MNEKEMLARIKAQVLATIEINKARDNFYAFCVYMDSKFFTPAKWHLKEAAEALQKVYEGVIKKLAVSMPPRAGKSYLISLFCAWMLGKFPEGSIMRNSYAAELAEKFSYDIREIVQKPKYLAVFPGTELKKDKRALQDWALTSARDISYFCAGVGGPITGKGCTLLSILDDPVKNIEEALSPTIIENIWKWYTSTHLSRLESGCPEIHIATRWSKKDPIGRLTDPESEEYSSDWHVINIPAMIDGKSFCEEIKTTVEYEEIKRVMEDFIWESEYMQQPFEVKGQLFPQSELKRFKMSDLEDKKYADVIGYTDVADEGDDYLCSVIGKRFYEKTYIIDVIYTRDPIEITEPLVAGAIIDTKCQLMNVEANAGGKSFALNIQKLIKGKTRCYCKYEPNTTNKETRILINSGYIKKNFYFRSDYEPGSHYDAYMRAMYSYVRMGKNKNDDAPDATTGMAEYCQTCPVPAPKIEETFGKGVDFVHPSVKIDSMKNKKVKEYYQKKYEENRIKIGG